MNAGCHGSDLSPVEAVETLDRRGALHRRRPAEYRIDYAACTDRPGNGSSPATSAEPRRRQAGRGLVRKFLARRGDTQPTQLPNAGSVFKNPPGDHAARLIESAGLKGLCQGRACVSERHANFIVNTGGASASDIERLIEILRARVAETHGILLEPEVRIVGEAPGGIREA